MSDLVLECSIIAKEAECDFAVDGAEKLTTFKGGGSACVFYPKDENSFMRTYSLLAARMESPCVLGGGSDMVIADGLCSVPLISTAGLDGIEVKDGKAYVGSGAYIRDVTRAFRENGLGGFEFLSGVPLTVGGAIKMNAGAFGAQTADYVDKIRVLKRVCDKNCEFEVAEISRADADFSYRKGVDDVILGAVLTADGTDVQTSVNKAKKYAALRAGKQPKYPSCGSVFKNGAVASGKLIEDCGLKGTRCGGAEISALHGNFIVNIGGATAADFMTLVRLAEDKEIEKYGIALQREFVYLQ